MTALVALDHVTFGYGGAPVLRAVDYRVMPGDFTGVVGPSGSGKTSLLKLLLGTVTPTHGTVTRASAPMPPGDVITDFSEWKPFSGINLPTLAIVTRNGEKAAEMKLAGVELNPAVDEKTFVKP